jgi:hypothetical protein
MKDYGLSVEEINFFRELEKPEKIQNFLDGFDYNYCHEGYECRSPRELLKLSPSERKAHCVDGALFAAACQRVNGKPPLVMEIGILHNEEHFIAPFKQEGLWGSIAHSRTYTLRWRDPIYRNIRELVLSYFLGCVVDGELTIRNYTRPINCARFDNLNWMTTDKCLEELGDRFENYKHIPLFRKEIELRSVPKVLEERYTKHPEKINLSHNLFE